MAASAVKGGEGGGGGGSSEADNSIKGAGMTGYAHGKLKPHHTANKTDSEKKKKKLQMLKAKL